MSQNQFLKYSINVNIQNRSVAFYVLVGIIHARKEVSKYHYSLFIFLSNNTIYFKNANNFTCKERKQKDLNHLLSHLLIGSRELYFVHCIQRPLMFEARFFCVRNFYNSDVTSIRQEAHDPAHYVFFGMIDVKESYTCSKFDRYEHYLGYTCRTICEISKEGHYYV